MGLERVGRGGTDQSGQDVCTDIRRMYCGWGCDERGGVAPCTLCEWCGICPQHYDVTGRPAGSEKAGTGGGTGG